MKYRFFFFVLAACHAFAALADPVPVQSGEHATFSRIVAPLQDADWTVIRNRSEVIVTYEDLTEGFQIASVFDLIPRDRVQAIRTTSDTLTLTLACDCAVSASIEQESYLVIDVADTSAALEQPENIIQPQSLLTEQQLTPTSEVLTSSWPKSRDDVRTNGFALPLNTIGSANSDLVGALQERLKIELKTATHRGILSGNVEEDSSAPEGQQPREIVEKPDVPEASDRTKDLSNLRISTSRDLPGTFRNLAEITRTQGEVCPPDTQMAVTKWGDLRPFSEQIADARIALYDERDQLDLEAALNLARSYIYFGFGAEAMATLRLNEKVYNDNPYLLAIAQIMDGQMLPEPNVLSGFAECAGEAAIWGMLAAPSPPKGALPRPDDALQTLNALPFHLRVLLAPKLHNVLLAYGNPTGAVQALRSLTRVTDDVPPAARVAQALGNLQEGHIEKGKRQMAQIVSENAAESPSALVAFVDAKLKANKPIDLETVQLVDAFSQELKHTDLGPDLRRIHTLALAQSGQFDAAFNTHNRAPQSEAAKVTHTELLAMLTQNASDIVFLEHAIAQPISSIADLPVSDAQALARRFLKLGFPLEAERVINTLPLLPQETEKQLLVAEVHLAMGKPFQAQADLIKLTGAAADRLRADAKRMSGLFDEAYDLYQQVDRPRDAAETAWLADNWRTLIEPQTATFGAAATLPETPAPLSGNNGMLSRTATLLDQSGQVRKTLKDLLSAEELIIENAE